MENIEKRVIKTISKINKETLIDDLNLNLFDAGILDSFGILSLLSGLEKEFGLQVQGEDLVMDNFVNINSIIKFVCKMQG